MNPDECLCLIKGLSDYFFLRGKSEDTVVLVWFFFMVLCIFQILDEVYA